MILLRWISFVLLTAATLDVADLGELISSHLAITTAFFYGTGALFAIWYFAAPPRKLIEHTDRSEAISDFVGTAVLASGMIGIPVLMLMRLKWAIF